MLLAKTTRATMGSRLFDREGPSSYIQCAFVKKVDYSPEAATAADAKSEAQHTKKTKTPRRWALYNTRFTDSIHDIDTGLCATPFEFH